MRKETLLERKGVTLYVVYSANYETDIKDRIQGYCLQHLQLTLRVFVLQYHSEIRIMICGWWHKGIEALPHWIKCMEAIWEIEMRGIKPISKKEYNFLVNENKEVKFSDDQIIGTRIETPADEILVDKIRGVIEEWLQSI